MAFLQIKMYANTMQSSTNVNVILPSYKDKQFLYKAYDKTSFAFYENRKKLPVLYLLHGSHGDEAEYTRNSRLEYYADEYDVIIVMPSCGNSRFMDMPRCGPAYYTYLTVELPMFIKWMFPASDKREDTFIGGFSMGAGGAFKVGMLNPGKYSHVIGISGSYSFPEFFDNDPDHTIWTLSFEKGVEYRGTIEDNYWVAEQAAKNLAAAPKLYMSCGTEDFVYPKHKAFRECLDKLGFQYTCHECTAEHNWDFWDPELRRILEWLPLIKRPVPLE